MGLIAAVELVQDKAARKHFDKLGKTGTICRDHCFANGGVMRAVRDSMVLSPPLTIATNEIDKLMAVLKKSLDQTAKDLGIA